MGSFRLCSFDYYYMDIAKLPLMAFNSVSDMLDVRNLSISGDRLDH